MDLNEKMEELVVFKALLMVMKWLNGGNVILYNTATRIMYNVGIENVRAIPDLIKTMMNDKDPKVCQYVKRTLHTIVEKVKGVLSETLTSRLDEEEGENMDFDDKEWENMDFDDKEWENMDFDEEWENMDFDEE